VNWRPQEPNSPEALASLDWRRKQQFCASNSSFLSGRNLPSYIYNRPLNRTEKLVEVDISVRI